VAWTATPALRARVKPDVNLCLFEFLGALGGSKLLWVVIRES
jgi:hypothetical protein